MHQFTNSGEKSKKPDALLYLIDVSEAATVESSVQEFNTLSKNENYIGIPILILGNKIDKNPSLSLGEFQNLLKKYLDKSITKYEVFMISGLRTIGINEVTFYLKKRLHKWD